MIKRTVILDCMKFDLRFRAVFGTSPSIVSVTWNLLVEKGDLDRCAGPTHLLWALMFLKLYCSESVHCSMAATEFDKAPHEETFRKWTWYFVTKIADLKDDIIVWENRLRLDKGLRCKITVDGTDFRIWQPTPFTSVWYTHKFKCAGLRYEVGIAIQSGDIVWLNGPFQPGLWPDLKIFRKALKGTLEEEGEMAEADLGYRGDQAANTPIAGQADMAFIARMRHETCNRRFKHWGVLGNRFTHDPRKHQNVFFAVANLTQLEIENGEPLFQVDY